MMKPLIVAVTVAAAGALAFAAPAAAKPKTGKPASTYDPNKKICKIRDDSSSRLGRLKVCFTAAEWDEQSRIEKLYLLQNQHNGAK
jgi:hypothetical protein